MKKSLLALTLCLLTPGLLHAEPASSESIDQLMKLTKVEDIIQQIHMQTDDMMMVMSQQMGIQDNEKQMFEQFSSDMQNLMRTEVTWEKMRKPMMEVYTSNFTQKEVDDMVAFYKTETGQSMITKMPMVMNQSMQASQQMLMGLMPKIQEMGGQFEQKIRESRKIQEQIKPQ